MEKIRQAKAMIEQWAGERCEAEKAVHDQKMTDRAEKEKRTGKKTPGRPPSPPEPDPRESDQVNFTDVHGDPAYAYPGLQPAEQRGYEQLYDSWRVRLPGDQ